MSTFNRLANTKNAYQGKMKKVLAVCSAGLLRSPTIAWVLSNEPYNCNTRAAGISNEYALVVLDLPLVEWADEIVCADKDHVFSVKELLKNENISDPDKPVHCLDLPDQFRTRDPILVKLIKDKLEKIPSLAPKTK